MMDTKPIQELIEAARRNRNHPAFDEELRQAANAAERALAAEDEALRLADELSKLVLMSLRNVGTRMKVKAREYRKARELEGK